MGRSLRLLAVGLIAAVWGCFSPPSADVLFSCDPDAAPACPPDYTCQSDGCCHRDGTDVDASRGACNSAATSGALPGISDTDPSSTGSTDTGSTDVGSTEASSTMGDTDATGATDAGPSETDSDGGSGTTSAGR